MRRPNVTVFAAAALIGLTGATALPTKAEIAESKRDMLEGADEAFLELWSKRESFPDGSQYTAAQIRQLSRWGFVTYSVGLCGQYLTLSDRALFEERIDAFSRSITSGKPDGISFVRQFVEGWRADGVAGRKQMVASNPQHFCSVELAAVRELIREL
jgi:hypothetical protein